MKRPRLLEGRLLVRADKPNGNGNIYPLGLLKKIVRDHEGEFVVGTTNDDEVSPCNLTHRAINLRIEDEALAPTPQGQNLGKVLKYVEFKLMGEGDVTWVEEGARVDNFKVTSVNAVLRV